MCPRDALGPVVFEKEKFALHLTRTHRGVAAGHAASWVVRHLPSFVASVALSEPLYAGHVVGMDKAVDRDALNPMALMVDCPSQHLGGAAGVVDVAEVVHVDFLEPPALAPIATACAPAASECAGVASSRNKAIAAKTLVQDMPVAYSMLIYIRDKHVLKRDTAEQTCTMRIIV